MTTLYMILLLLAAVCFLLSAVGAVLHRRLSLVSLGLFFWVLVPFIQTIKTM